MSIMMNELLTAPQVIRDAIATNKTIIKEIAREFKARKLTNITTVARGTSDNASTFFKYLCEVIGGLMVSKFTPSVSTVYKTKVNLRNNLVVAVSQSGMSTDTMLVVNDAKESGALVVAITNNVESPLAKAADFHLFLNTGDEKSVAATKTFTAQLAVLYMLANELAPHSAKVNLAEIPAILDTFIADYATKIADFAHKTKKINNMVILTRGLMQGVAIELSLKLLETCYLFSRPFSTSDFMHGPLAIVEEGTNIFVLAPSGELKEEFIDMVTRLSLLGANITAITDIEEVANIATTTLKVPTYHSLVAPFVYTVAIQLFAANMAETLGRNPDAPRSLKKVTITK